MKTHFSVINSLLLIWAGVAGAASPETLTQLRLEPTNLKATVMEKYQGESLPVRIEYENGSQEHQPASLALANRGLLPFSPAIPPYVGLNARGFSVKLWIENMRGIKSIEWIVERMGATPVIIPMDIHSLKMNQWNETEFHDSNMGSVEHPVNCVVMKIDESSLGKIVAYIGAPVLILESGKSYSLLTPDVPLMMAGMEKPLATQPARPLPQRDMLVLGGYGIDDEVPAMAEFMKKHFPEADFVLAPVWAPGPGVARLLPKLPENVYFEFQKAQLNSKYLQLLDALPRDADGHSMTEFGNSTVATHPLMQQGLKDEVDYGASLGINNFKQIDYSWPWHNSHVGYDPASITAFRQDLNGKDEGLALLAGPGGLKAGMIHFWDYYEDNHGMRLSPGDLGIQSWKDFKPVSDHQAADGGVREKKNLGVMIALVHYEWLKQAQRFGRWAKRHGGQHNFTLNPEDVGNGGDFIYLIRLADVGTSFFEYFGGPSILRGAYSHLPTYMRTAKIAGEKLGVITEIGQCGHGENYWDPAVGYLILYELGALGFAHYHNEWVEASWSVMSDPKNEYHYDRFCAWMSQAMGLRQARREGAYRPASKVVSVSLRDSLNYMQSWLWSDQQMDSFGPALSEAHIDFEETDPMGLPEILDNTDVIFYTPPVSRQQDGQRIIAWLKRGGKTLITHSYIPLSEDQGIAKLRPGVTNVEFRGEEFSYADFLDPTQATDGPFTLTSDFTGLKKTLQDYWQFPANTRWRQVSLGIGLESLYPLLSQIDLPNNSRILYLHRRPKDLMRGQLSKVIEKIAILCAMPRLAIENSKLGGSVLAHRFHEGNVDVMILWNTRQLQKLGDIGGYGSHLLPDRGPNNYDLKKRPYPILAADERCGALVPVQTPGVYRIYRFLEDREETVLVGKDLQLPLMIDDLLAEQFYYAPDTPVFADEIKKLKQHRKAVEPYIDNQQNLKSSDVAGNIQLDK